MLLNQKTKGELSRKISFGLFALLFLSSQLFAAPSITVPSEVGRIETVHQGSNGKTIFLIQEAHVDYNAQKAIAEILKHLIQKENLRLILVEGGWTDMRLRFKKGIGQEEQLRRAEDYLKRGLIAAEEYLNLTTDLSMMIWGIENADNYRENMEVFLKFHNVQNQLLVEIQKLKEALTPLQDKIFSSTAKEFETERKAFGENQSSLIHYSRFLRDKVDSKTFDSFPQLKRLMALQGEEKSFDPDKVEHEKQEIIRALSRTVTRLEFDRISLLNERKKSEDELEFIKALLALYNTYQSKLPKLDVKNLTRYSQILESVLQNDARGIFNAVKTLEKAALERLELSADEKALFHLIDSVEMLEKLFRLEMNPDDFEAVQKNPNVLNPLSWKNTMGPAVKVDFELLNEWIDVANAFYHSAMKREQALIRNAVQKIEETGLTQAVILVGGFHAERMSAELSKQGYSVNLISPKFESQDLPEHQQKYFQVLKDSWNQVANKNLVSKEGVFVTT